MNTLRSVYFIKPVGMDGPIKIGVSANPEARRASLQVACPFDLEVVAQLESTSNLERRFHAMFHDSHRRNEWFDHTPELAKVIDELRSGSFDAACLPMAVYLPRPSRPKQAA